MAGSRNRMFGCWSGNCSHLCSPSKADVLVWVGEKRAVRNGEGVCFQSSSADIWPAAQVLGFSCPPMKGGPGS